MSIVTVGGGGRGGLRGAKGVIAAAAIESFAEPLFDAGTHTMWTDLRSNGAGSVGAVPGTPLSNSHGDTLYGADNGTPDGDDYIVARYLNSGCLDDPPADSVSGWANGGHPDAGVRTMISTWYFRPQSGYQWINTPHGSCTGNDQKFELNWREGAGGSGQRFTMSARSSGDTTQTRNWGYTPARDFSPGGVACDWTYNVSGGISAMSYQNYGEAGGESVHPYQIDDGLWHRTTLELRKESSVGAGDGKIAHWIDGHLVAWYDGEDASRAEFGEVNTLTNTFGRAWHYLGVHNRGTLQQQDMDMGGWHAYYPTSEAP